MKLEKQHKKILLNVMKICKKQLNAKFQIPEDEKSTITLAKNIGLGLHPKWDSIAHLDIIFLIEKKFKIKANHKNIKNFGSIDKISNYIYKKNKSK